MQIKFPETEEVISKKKLKLSEKLYLYRRPIFSGVLAFLALAAISLQLTWKKSGSTKEFFGAQHYLSRLEEGAKVDTDQIRKYLAQFPELHPFFDHHLLQHFMLENQLEQTAEISRSILKRLSFLDAPFRVFSEGTLAIEEGRYQEAQKLSESLLRDLEGSKTDEYVALKKCLENRLVSLAKALVD